METLSAILLTAELILFTLILGNMARLLTDYLLTKLK